MNFKELTKEELRLLTNDELKEIITKAEDRAYIYKGTRDGSYGAALDRYGYYKAKAELLGRRITDD